MAVGEAIVRTAEGADSGFNAVNHGDGGPSTKEGQGGYWREVAIHFSFETGLMLLSLIEFCL